MGPDLGLNGFYLAGYCRLKCSQKRQERRSRREPSVRGPAIHQRRLCALQRTVPGRPSLCQRVSAQMDRTGISFGLPPGFVLSSGRTRTFLATRTHDLGTNRLVHHRRTPLCTYLSMGEEVVLLRTAQETLPNVRKHAQASKVVLQLQFSENNVDLVILDDGAGFDTTTSQSGFGLSGMQARATQVGGCVVVDSSPGKGTRVQVSL